MTYLSSRLLVFILMCTSSQGIFADHSVQKKTIKIKSSNKIDKNFPTVNSLIGENGNKTEYMVNGYASTNNMIEGILGASTVLASNPNGFAGQMIKFFGDAEIDSKKEIAKKLKNRSLFRKSITKLGYIAIADSIVSEVLRTSVDRVAEYTPAISSLFLISDAVSDNARSMIKYLDEESMKPVNTSSSVSSEN